MILFCTTSQQQTQAIAEFDAIIIGPEERKAGEVVVRDLNGGTEERVPMATLLNGYFR